MPAPGRRWRHVIINTKNSWLHGDVRGFRDRRHRIHSSGDYKTPPPEHEHAGLRKWAKGRAGDAICIPSQLREPVGLALTQALEAQAHTVLACSVAEHHAHALVDLPDDIRQIRAIIGNAKRAASRAVRRHLPGSIWSAGGQFKPIRDRSHHRNTHDYIAFRQGPDAWMRSFVKDPLPSTPGQSEASPRVSDERC